MQARLLERRLPRMRHLKQTVSPQPPVREEVEVEVEVVAQPSATSLLHASVAAEVVQVVQVVMVVVPSATALLPAAVAAEVVQVQVVVVVVVVAASAA